MTGTRFSIAGPLMLAGCALAKKRVRITRHDALRILGIAVLLLTTGNMLLSWTEQYLPSGLASLFVAIVPIYIAVIEGLVLKGERLRSRGWFGLAFGILGLVLLLWPKLRGTLEGASTLARTQLIACVVVLLGSLSWACGSILSRRSQLSVDPFAATGWEMTFAGVINLSLGALLGDFHRVVWARSGLLAIGYLIVFGSWVGFTAYIWLLDHVPAPKVATYAYVNPVVAVILGFFIAGETLDRYSFAGMIAIVVAVAVITSSQMVRVEAAAPSGAEA